MTRMWIVIRLLVLLLAIGPATSGYAGCPDEARNTLRKWGAAYCISKHMEGRAEQGGAAMGGYFELGSHQSEEAYDNVRRFFDNWATQRPAVPKAPGTDLSLMTCLEAYESEEYRQVIEAQDAFLPGGGR